MRYSQTTFQVIKDDPARYNGDSATSPANIYQSELIDFVYKEVTIALNKRTKGDSPRFDLDSVQILKNAELRVREKLLSKIGVLN
jgi:hypothetical protein